MASFESIHIYRNIANIFIHNEQQIYVYKYTCVYIYLHHGVLYVYVSMYLHTVSVHMLHLCTNLSTCLSFYLYLFSKMHIELCVYIYMQNMYIETKGLKYYLLCSHLVLLLTSQPILKQKTGVLGSHFFLINISCSN